MVPFSGFLRMVLMGSCLSRVPTEILITIKTMKASTLGKKSSCIIPQFRAPWLGLAIAVCPFACLGDPLVSYEGGSTIRLEWSSECDKQYTLLTSEGLQAFAPISPRFIGTGGMLSCLDDISGARSRFFRVEESSDFLLDLTRLKLGRIGNRWSYAVSQDVGSGPQFYESETEVVQRTMIDGKEVIELRTKLDDAYVGSSYVLDDLSTAILEIGTFDARSGITEINDPPAPSIFANFTPGVVIPLSVGLEMTITVDQSPLTVGAGTFSPVLKVTATFTGTLLGYAATETTTRWYALDVGVIKARQRSVVAALGLDLLSESTLISYQVD